MHVDQERPGRDDAALDLPAPSAAELREPAMPEAAHDRNHRCGRRQAAGRDRDRAARQGQREQQPPPRRERAGIPRYGYRALQLAVEGRFTGHELGV